MTMKTANRRAHSGWLRIVLFLMLLGVVAYLTGRCIVEKPPASESAPAAKVSSSTFQFEKLAGGTLKSPAGLLYKNGPGDEHRLNHVLRHAQDNLDRPVHSVFYGERNEILAAIDQAFELIKTRSDAVKSTRDGDRVVFTVDMQRVIGYEGGRAGLENGRPETTSLRLVLANDCEVITAYPINLRSSRRAPNSK